MDVLKPDLLWIDRCCYRKNPVNPSYNMTGSSGPYEETDEFQESSDKGPREDEDEFNYEGDTSTEICIEKLRDGRFQTSMSIPNAYYSYIVGTKGQTKKRLQMETKTVIKIPPLGAPSSDVVIIGESRNGVIKAHTRLEVMVLAARKRQPFTHFLSIPLNSEDIKKGFELFKTNVLEDCVDCRGMDPSLFQKPEKLHLTIATLVLLNDAERKAAADLLASCKLEIIDPIIKNEPLTVMMSGLEYMNDDPAEVDVLYGKVEYNESSEKLQELVDGLVKVFACKGLIDKEYDRVKLHMTVMNTVFRKDDSGVAETSRKKGRESFDAKRVLQLYDTHDFGEQKVESVHLSLRYSTGSEGYYQYTSKVNLY